MLPLAVSQCSLRCVSPVYILIWTLFVDFIGFIMDLLLDAATLPTLLDDVLPASALQLDLPKELDRNYWLSLQR